LFAVVAGMPEVHWVGFEPTGRHRERSAGCSGDVRDPSLNRSGRTVKSEKATICPGVLQTAQAYLGRDQDFQWTSRRILRRDSQPRNLSGGTPAGWNLNLNRQRTRGHQKRYKPPSGSGHARSRLRRCRAN
jgi:hypothetical protein